MYFLYRIGSKLVISDRMTGNGYLKSIYDVYSKKIGRAPLWPFKEPTAEFRDNSFQKLSALCGVCVHFELPPFHIPSEVNKSYLARTYAFIVAIGDR